MDTMAEYKLVVEVAGARGLMPSHRQGSASACVGLNFDGQWFCTAVREKDLNPVWNECFYFNVSDPSNLPKLVLEAYVHYVNKSARGGVRSFLDRVRICGSAIPLLSNDVALQYHPLEKRSLRQRINGELGMKVYMIPAMLLQENQSLRPHDMPLQHLKEITNNFSDERILGRGGFGVVYKGVLQNGETIAVKKITSTLMPGLQKQFESEVYHLMMAKHPNIVRCVGYCYETRNACLEYNGKYVFAETA